MSFCHEWDEAKAIPKELFIKTAKAGFQGAIVGHVDTNMLPYGLPAGIDPKEWDNFHTLIVTDELARCGSGGVSNLLRCSNFFLTNSSLASLGIMWRFSYWSSSCFALWFSVPQGQGS